MLNELSLPKYFWVDVLNATMSLMWCSLDQFLRKPLMNFTKVENLTLVILKFLVAIVLYLIIAKKTLQSFMLNMMKVFLLDTH